MKARIALLAFPFALTQLIALAQAPPPDVDKALRERATQFFQCYVDGNFRKAYEMVAEDTKDQFFNAAKNTIKSFQLGEIKYSDNFTKAAITVKATRDMYLLGQNIPTDLSEVMTFKLEEGKWVWYWINQGYIVTPMDVSRGTPVNPGAAPANPGAGALPGLPDFSNMQAAAQKLLAQSGIDKSEVVLATGKASEAKVVFHNGLTGPVQVQLAQFGTVPGFSAKLDKTQVGASENAELLVQYTPGDQKLPEGPIELRLAVTPTAQSYTVTVKFTAASGQ